MSCGNYFLPSRSHHIHWVAHHRRITQDLCHIQYPKLIKKPPIQYIRQSKNMLYLISIVSIFWYSMIVWYRPYHNPNDTEHMSIISSMNNENCTMKYIWWILKIYGRRYLILQSIRLSIFCMSVILIVIESIAMAHDEIWCIWIHAIYVICWISTILNFIHQNNDLEKTVQIRILVGRVSMAWLRN